MEGRLMHVFPEKCTACRNCEQACAFAHLHEGKPTRARIRADADPQQRERKNVLVVCYQCDAAACVSACPANALWRDMKTGAVYHVAERCIRCASCVAACPFGNMRWEPLNQSPSKCDLCKGDPVCVRFCPTGAIQYK